jgi:phosphopantetheinyl transferase
VPLYSCASVGLFPETPAAVRQLAAAQWSQKVRFRETVLKMHDDGVRVFIEVGPSANLTAFVNDILIDRDYVAAATNVRRKGGVEQFLGVLGQLYLVGRPPALDRLFSRRAIAALDLQGGVVQPKGVLLDNTMPMVRLTEADRSLLRGLMPAAAAFTATEPSARMEPAAPAAAEAMPDGSDIESPEAAAQARVMADYFDVMRGFLDQQRSVVESWPVEADGEIASAGGGSPTSTWPSTHTVDHRTPLLDEIVSLGGGRVHARCRVSLINDRFIRDHVMSGPVSGTDPTLFGLSCVPFTVSLEVMAEACTLLAGRHDVHVIQNVKAFDWVTLDDEALEFEVHAEVLDAALGLYAARVVTPRGTALSAEFVFEADWRLSGVPELAERRESCLNSPNLYATGMFHGPVFQSMSYVEAWDDSGIDVQLTGCTLDGFFAEGQRPQLVLNPVLLDAMGQVVACWLVQYVGTSFHAFPSTIDRLELYEACPADRQGIVLRMRQRPSDGVSTDITAPRAWQFDCVDAEGRVLMRGHDLVNLFFVAPPAYHEFRCDPLGGWLGRPSAVVLAPEVQLWEVPLMTEEFCSQSGAICLRIMAHALLAASERAEWRALAATPLRRRREWLFGRAALKEATRAWVQGMTGQWLYPTDIVVRHDAQGAPSVDGWWCEHVIPAPRVSLSHDSRACLAAVAPSDLPVGVDFEAFGRVRQPELIVDSLAPSERGLVQGLHGVALEERVLRLWCAKEAAAKCLGIGLQGQPEAFRVIAADEGFETLVVEHELGTVETRLARQESTIIALAVMGGVEVDG